jgi:Mce-associated membrane protein
VIRLRIRKSGRQQEAGPTHAGAPNEPAEQDNIEAKAPAQHETAKDNEAPTTPDSTTADSIHEATTEAEESGTKGSNSVDEATTEAEDSEKKGSSIAASVRARDFFNKISWARVFAYRVLPVFALVLVCTAAFMKWQDYTVQAGKAAGVQAVKAASDTAAALLSYRPDTVDNDLAGAQQRLTGSFRDNYSKLTVSLVIPAAKRDKITAQASVRAAALVSSTANRAVVLLSVNQTITMGAGAPSNSSWSVRATVDKAGDRWLVSAFDPV